MISRSKIRTIAVALVALLVASALGYWGYNHYKKRAPRRAGAADDESLVSEAHKRVLDMSRWTASEIEKAG